MIGSDSHHWNGNYQWLPPPVAIPAVAFSHPSLAYINKQKRNWVSHCRNGDRRNSGAELKLYLDRTGSTCQLLIFPSTSRVDTPVPVIQDSIWITTIRPVSTSTSVNSTSKNKTAHELTKRELRRTLSYTHNLGGKGWGSDNLK